MYKLLIFTLIIVGIGSCETPTQAGPPDRVSPPAVQSLPSWLKLGAEIRGRLEAPAGIGYVPDAQDTYYLHRIRFNATVKMAPFLRSVIQIQDSQAPGFRRRPVPAGVANTLDLRMAYVEAGSEEGTPWLARVGRQPLVFGDMRLVSTSNWGNVGPAFDGARFTYRSTGVRLDWFTSAVVTPVAGQFDRPRSDRRLHGFYSTFQPGRRLGTVEAYLFSKDNLFASMPSGHSGRLNVYTIGTHAFGKLWMGFDYNAEVAMQTGHLGQSEINAWAGHWESGIATGTTPWRPRLSVEYNYATGDRDTQDATVRTFDNLYPTDKFGTADGIAWRNIHESIFSAEWKPARKWKTKVCYHGFWLASRADALYGLGGAVLAHNPNATSARVGGEVDFRLIYQRDAHLQFFGGYGYFLPGPYIKQSTHGAGTHIPYVMWTYTF